MKATGLLWEALVVEVLTAPEVALRAVVPAGGSAFRMRVTAAAPDTAGGAWSVSAWAICGPFTMYGAGYRVSGGS
jgi:hypothetical protein